MAAATVILLTFGVAGIPLTYLCSFLFTDEMKALQVRFGLQAYDVSGVLTRHL